jgi:teichuronic acid biosynthesis glycosyltransferase TuaC
VEGIFHRTVCEALVRRGVEVEVLAPVPWVPPGLGFFSGKYAAYDRKPKHEVLNGVKVHRPRYMQIPRGNYLGWTHRQFARLAARELSKGFDVIHAHYAYPCGLAAVKAGRKPGVPTVVTVHGSDVNSFPDVSPLTRRLFCDAIRDADIVTAVGQAVAERTHARTGRMPIHLPIGIQMQRFQKAPGKQAARNRLKLSQEDIVVLYVGDLLAAKGIRELVRALESLRDPRILGLFVGDGPLRKEVRQSAVTRSDGTRPNEEMAVYMAAADVLVLPSYGEGLPTVLVEAGAVGVPILATSVGGIPELLTNDRGLLVASHSAEALAQGIREVIAGPDAARRRTERCRNHVKQHYDVDHNAASLVELYESVPHLRPEACPS